MKNKVTIHDIAKLLDVSPSTVSRALSNNPRISLKTREAVHELAREHGYQPNNIASSLRKGKSYTIGVVVPRISRSFFASVIGGMEEILNPAGYNLVICQSNENHETETANLKSLSNLRVDAIFISLAASTNDSSYLSELIAGGTQVIMFDRIDPVLQAPRVILDDYRGAREIVRHLVEQGYRRIYHYAGPSNITVYSERLKGYLDAMKEAGLEVEKDMIIPDVITREKAYDVFMKSYKKKDFDAVFASSDFSALGILLGAREKNISIPEELGIAGFANEPFTGFLQPGITTIDQKAKQMGEKVAELYLDMDNISLNHTEIIIPELITRGSSIRNQF